MTHNLIVPRRGFLVGALSGLIAAPFVNRVPNVLMPLRGELLDPWVLAYQVERPAYKENLSTVLFENVPMSRWKEIVKLSEFIRNRVFDTSWNYQIMRKSQTKPGNANFSYNPETFSQKMFEAKRGF